MAAKILLADSEHNLLTSMEYLFQRHHYETLVCLDGDKAIDLIHQHQPALVLADVTLPGQSGFEICQYLKTSRTFSNIAIVLLSARARLSDEAKAKALGADALILKPFSINAMLSKVDNLLGSDP
jgi:DNA-binding response OmpR family regulator